MKRSRRRIGFAVGALTWGILFALDRPGRGEEESLRFLEGLRARGYFDVALDYLEQMATSPLAADSFRREIPLQRGMVLVEAGRRSTDLRSRDELFDQARQTLQTFASSATGTHAGTKAQNQNASLLLERGRALLAQAENLPAGSGKERLLAEARGHFDQGRTGFQACEAFYARELEDKTKFPAAIDEQKDASLFAMRQEYRAELVQARLLAATAVYESTATLPADSPQRAGLLRQAAGQFAELHQKYRTWLAGLYACFYQGRCHQDLRDYEEALGCFTDLLNQSDSEPAFRTLICRAHRHALECLIEQKKYDAAIAKGKQWLGRAQNAESRDPHWLAVTYQVARADQLKASGLAKPQQNEAQRLQAEARDLARQVARHPNDFQIAARQLLAELPGGEPALQDPKTFDEALERAREAIDQLSGAQNMLGILDENAPEEVKNAQETIRNHSQQAARYARLALSLAESGTDLEKVNQARYFLCAVDYQQNRWYDAAVMGEFLARHYPQSSGARTGALIALSSYLNAFNEPENRQQEFDAQRAVAIARHIMQTWPEQPEADKARDTLVGFAIRQKAWDEARELLAKISPDYSALAAVELKLGQALWSQYTRDLRLPEEGRPTAQQLDALKKAAREALEKGVRRAQKEAIPVTPLIMGGSLSLAQVYLDAAQYQEAITLLEDPLVGPLTMATAPRPDTQYQGYFELAYLVALQSYIAASPPNLEKAQQMLSGLERLAAAQKDQAAQERLTQLLLNMGLQLQRRLQSLVAAGKEQEVTAVAKSFELFLEHISSRNQGADWATRNWVAATYYDLGSGLNAPSSPAAKAYFSKARDAYRQILAEVERGTLKAPSDGAVLAIQMRLAACRQRTGDFKEALAALKEVLKKKPNLLEAQMETARLYQTWGAAGDARHYLTAIGGEEPAWGWGKLSQSTARHAEHRDIFHEARYNLAKCRFEYAKRQAAAAERQKYLQLAKKDIGSMVKLYPDLGGDNWREKYDRLLKEIQTTLGEPSRGVKEFETPPASPGKK